MHAIERKGHDDKQMKMHVRMGTAPTIEHGTIGASIATDRYHIVEATSATMRKTIIAQTGGRMATGMIISSRMEAQCTDELAG